MKKYEAKFIKGKSSIKSVSISKEHYLGSEFNCIYYKKIKSLGN